MIGVLFIILAKLLQENPGVLHLQHQAQTWLYAFGIVYVIAAVLIFLVSVFED